MKRKITQKSLFSILLLGFILGIQMFSNIVCIEYGTNGTYESDLLPSYVEGDILVWERRTTDRDYLDDTIGVELAGNLAFIENSTKNDTEYYVNASVYQADGLEVVLSSIFTDDPKTKEDIDTTFWNYTLQAEFHINNSVSSIFQNLTDYGGLIAFPRDANMEQLFDDTNNQFFKTEVLDDKILPNIIEQQENFPTIVEWNNYTIIRAIDDDWYNPIIELGTNGELYNEGLDMSLLFNISQTIEMNISQDGIVQAYYSFTTRYFKIGDEVNKDETTTTSVELVYDSNPERWTTWFGDNKAWFLPVVIGGGVLIPLVITRQVMISKCTKSGEPNAFCKDPAKYRKEKYIKELEKGV